VPTVYYIAHPEVLVDPEIPVPLWDLSAEGHRRLRIALSQPWIQTIEAIFSSHEQKAKTTAQYIAHHIGVKVTTMESLGEIDRSSTGYLPHKEHIQVAKACFAHPEESVRGWERAVDAQKRSAQAVNKAIEIAPRGVNIAIVAHGGVGTLLLSRIKGHPITWGDAAPGQGYYYAFDRETKALIHDWQAIDET
jgi:broad specificity phosphatase PhoE